MRGFRCQVESIFGPREHGMTCMLYLLPRRKTIPAWLSLTHGFRYFLRTEPPTFRSISTRRFLVRVDVICQIQMQKSKQSKSLDAETALNLHFFQSFLRDKSGEGAPANPEYARSHWKSWRVPEIIWGCRWRKSTNVFKCRKFRWILMTKWGNQSCLFVSRFDFINSLESLESHWNAILSTFFSWPSALFESLPTWFRWWCLCPSSTRPTTEEYIRRNPLEKQLWMAPNWGSSFQVTLHRKSAMWCGADVKILMISAITRSDNAKIHWMTFLDCLSSWAETVWQHAVLQFGVLRDSP